MRELDAVEVTTAVLEPGREQTLLLGQPHPDTLLLSHFEVIKLSPSFSDVALTDLRIERLSYLITPVPLLLLQREQQNKRENAERKTRQQLQRLSPGPWPAHLLQGLMPNRRETRLIALDIRWKTHQPLTVTFKNCGTAVVDKVSIALVLYAHDEPLPVAN